MVTIYTTPTCGICKVIKKKLEENNIQYKENQDENFIINTFNTNVVPILKTEEGNILMGAINIKKWIENK